MVTTFPRTFYSHRCCTVVLTIKPQLARSLRISLPAFAALQIVATVAAFAVGYITYNSESWNDEDYDVVYYATIPLWLLEISVLW